METLYAHVSSSFVIQSRARVKLEVSKMSLSCVVRAAEEILARTHEILFSSNYTLH